MLIKFPKFKVFAALLLLICTNFFELDIYAMNSSYSLSSNAQSISIKTTRVRYIGIDSAIMGGVIVDKGSENILRAGLCYSLSPQPTIANSIVERIGNADSFTCVVKNLEPEKAYYVRAFLETSNGVIYGPQRTFATDPLLIGSYIHGGFVFYIFKPGEAGYVEGEKHGLVVATNTNTTTYSWRNLSDTLLNVLDSSIGSGSTNTQLIVAALGQGDYAAKICDDLVLNGYSDWYLPSALELDALMKNKVRPGLNAQFWSSTEISSTLAQYINVAGVRRAGLKSTKYRVIAIRKF